MNKSVIILKNLTETIVFLVSIISRMKKDEETNEITKHFAHGQIFQE